MRGGAYMRGLIRGVTQMSRKSWAHLREAFTRKGVGGGGGGGERN